MIFLSVGMPLVLRARIKNHIMNQNEMSAIIDEAFPQLKEEIGKKGFLHNAYKLIGFLTDFTREKLSLHDLNTTIRSFRLVDKIYTKGDLVVKNAIENIFVFSFSHLQGNCTTGEWRKLQAEIPLSLHTLYIKQVCQFGN